MSEKLKIVYRPLQELSPYAHNARTHSTEQVAQLVESIKQFGWTNPVLIDEKGEIIAGHGRVMAAEMLKMDSVPVIVLSGLTDEQKKAYRLADNRAAINSMFTRLSGELNELAVYEAGYQLSLFDSLLPDFVADVHPLVGISPDALYAAAMARPFQGRLLSEWASDLEADRLRRITNTVRQGFLLGDTNEQIARKIRGHVSKGFQDGALQMSRANAASIAKTAVGHLAATARESFASANNDLIKGKQWLSTLDNRTTPQCRIRDRLKYTLNNKPVGHSVPYLQGPGKIHFCCRSTETFILKSAKELGIDVRDISPAERASMDGVVAGDTTYREWFLRQPYTRQKQIVGETRAKLIRDGGMSPDEFYTDKGEWLTLKQLRERDAQVFRKAGI
ncbi:TPA: ParB N-terminal domain-containing protein [Escherichia coli]|nr:ParB N-terminal domain-containing protein [Escherichia coli]HBC9970407.1 ParB N-terminal domain-containing protein [Escherichia coli]HCW2765923.1 ParB N-terminal domain-containing protein [Escherichia coli]HDX9405139.1 ParB N-terminal domain-containing protein [Escherichia coli]